MKGKKTPEELLEEFEKILAEGFVPSEVSQRSRAYEKDGKGAAKSLNKLFQKDLMVLRKMQG